MLLRAPEGADGGLEAFREAALRAAQEASQLAEGPGFRAWWAALLRQGRLPRERPGGVALLTPTLASGRHFRKAYLLGAVEGAYGAGEREDYFVPEDDRRRWTRATSAWGCRTASRGATPPCSRSCWRGPTCWW